MIDIGETLHKGDVSSDGKLAILDEDRLCYQVRMRSNNAVRTISKDLLAEFVGYRLSHADSNANDARAALSGKSQIDKFEYGYASPVFIMAGMVLNHSAKQGTLHSVPSNASASTSKASIPRQVIYYGAPGTGKSRAIKVQTVGQRVVRTTFHPDSDYSTFVGAYKPTTKKVFVRDSTGRVVVENGERVEEDRIVYEFVPQAFLQAYVSAWQSFADAKDGELTRQYLVIEEINRGNCAQIFGDLFQLLDRNDEGYSEYPVNADKDMEKYLLKAFAGIDIPNEKKLALTFGDENIAQKIVKGQVLVLPPNLYIWATMNTSDQSLFPIDSAFKRRWDWKYVPISEAVCGKDKLPLGWKICVGGKEYDWWKFLQAINKEIGNLTNSQDKKLGYFFCKAKNGRIDAETFVDKVAFFLWNEVLKDFEKEQDFLKDADDGYIEFNQFYKVNELGDIEIQEAKVVKLLENLGVDAITNGGEAEPENAGE